MAFKSNGRATQPGHFASFRAKSGSRPSRLDGERGLAGRGGGGGGGGVQRYGFGMAAAVGSAAAAALATVGGEEGQHHHHWHQHQQPQPQPQPQPPPSTLAAQLVENISVGESARSSGREETTEETARLLAVIERVKNQPDLLKTPAERVEHNHMLIYVYGSVVLENLLHWDEPFADHARLRAEAVKALDFFRIVVRETPRVLDCATDGRTYLLRGREPLWLWVLPKVLKMLGRAQCEPIQADVEGFCVYLLTVVAERGSLWHLGPLLMRYFEANFGVILSQLKSAGPHSRNSVRDIELPSKAFLDSLTADDARGCRYTIRGYEHALRHAAGLLTLVRHAVWPKNETNHLSAFFRHHLPWLLDSLASLARLQTAWQPQNPSAPTVSPAPLLQMTVDLAATYGQSSDRDPALCQKIYAALAEICRVVLDPSQSLSGQDGDALRSVVCLALVQLTKGVIDHKPVSRLVESSLITALQRIGSENGDDNANGGLESDTWRASQLLLQAVSGPPHSVLSEPFLADQFKEPRIREHIVNLRFGQPATESSPVEPMPKRRKLTAGSGMLAEILSRFQSLFGIELSHDVGTSQAFLDAFSRMDEARKCQAIDLLTRLPCGVDDTLKRLRTTPRCPVAYQCSFCSSSGDVNTMPTCQLRAGGLKTWACATFAKALVVPSFVESKRPRIVAMIAVRRLVQHSADGSLWDVEKSAAGKWCLQSLQSSVRELRIAAGRALAVFLGGPAEPGLFKGIIKRNRASAIAVLRALSEKDVTHLHESCIMAWGQVGRVVSDGELNLVLIKLLEYLSHRNTIVSAFAFNEMLNLAEARRVTPTRLLQPFWDSLAFTALKDLVTKPQATRMVAELLQVDVPTLLRMLQQHALPWLVVTKKRDVIQKIAEARGETETWHPCLDRRNLPSILALVLIQDTPDIVESSMSLMRQINDRFEDTKLDELLRTDPLSISLELIKAGCDGNDSRKAKVRDALFTMWNLLYSDSEGDHRQKKSVLVARFLEQQALGLTARLSEVINDTLNQQLPMQDRRRGIAAMEAMITLSKSCIGIARPQISACLLSALSVTELRSAAFSCWDALLRCVEETDVEILVETTFFIVGHYWHCVDEDTRSRIKTMLLNLLKKDVKLLTEYANKLPSLAHINDLAEINAHIKSMQTELDSPATFALFVKRLSHENPGVVHKALLELTAYLGEHQAYLQASAISEQPDKVVASLARALLDCSARYNGWQASDDTEAGVVEGIGRLCAEALGLVGCLDPNRVGGVGEELTAREQRHFVVAHNFEDASETTDFVVFMLEHVLVKAFVSATDTKFQGFLSWAMQELLLRVDLSVACGLRGAGDCDTIYRKWMAMSEEAREVLTPFLTSRYTITPLAQQSAEYPIVRPGKPYASWIRTLVLDLLRHGQNAFSQLVFEPLCRLIKVTELTVTEFLLPYVALHVVTGQEQSSDFRYKIKAELAELIKYEAPENASYVEREQTKLYYEAGFRILDYFMRWIQAKKAQAILSEREKQWVVWVQEVIDSLDPQLVSQRAMDCKDYARALFFLEPFIAEQAKKNTSRDHARQLFKQLQDVYTHIDDPDGLEGVVSRMSWEDLSQQAINHLKAGRWTAAQTWFEIRLADSPEDADIQLDLLTCLKESGQHDVLLNYVEGMKCTASSVPRIVPYAAEASWATGRWQTLAKYLRLYKGDASEVFNIGVGQALLFLKEGDLAKFNDLVRMMRDKLAGLMTYSATSSMFSSHDAMLKCHVLSDLEIIANNNATEGQGGRERALAALSRRLEVLGADVGGKQYLLGIRRAAMELVRPQFVDADISSSWLTSARLGRKAGLMHQSFNAVLHAQRLRDLSASIENAKLLYKEGHHRKAIQVLQNSVNAIDLKLASPAPPASGKNPETRHDVLKARTLLLLTKWLDSTGQTHASALRSKYQEAAQIYPQWEKGHYYLGRHYKKVLESEKALRPDQQSDEFLTGEMAKLVIENYMRSLSYGTKYIYQTLPRILTLWLELGAEVVTNQPYDGRLHVSAELRKRRADVLKQLHHYLKNHIPRLPAYIFYTALPQIVARIAHPNTSVFKLLHMIIVKVVEAHPRQALWTLFSFITSRQGGGGASATERRERGVEILQTLRGMGSRVRSGGGSAAAAGGGSYSLKDLVRMGEKLASQLLLACVNGNFSKDQRTVTKSITRDLNFNHKCTPCPLVVPVEACLTATLPPVRTDMTNNYGGGSSTGTGSGTPTSVARHKAFSRDVITINSFLDQVLVLNSLAKPRKLTARGSDGRLYGLLIKPKDDLRTDQRLMEFNAQINRSLKRDAESSRRQLYIRTYAVTPLNEECGIIEWVDGLRTLRDILLSIYKTMGRQPNYSSIEKLMKESVMAGGAGGNINNNLTAADGHNTDRIQLFTEGVLGQFPPVLPQWFTASFPAPSAWLAARLRYTRSCAVMSMVGTILGLGDRHGENVLLEEGNGGVFHVDFNCLFDKGLTFAQPERVPFRLTHNMVAAMGIHGPEGAFRACCELTLRALRQQEETLMTILEAFVHDPTLDLQRNKKRAAAAAAAAAAAEGVGGGGGRGGEKPDRLDPNGVVASIRRKVRGLLPDESIPLGVEGQVEELIKQATDPRNLAAMYIGWCPFL